MSSSKAQTQFEFADGHCTAASGGSDTTGTFADSLRMPIHRWFGFPAGFSARWVGEVIAEHSNSGAKRVLDPFVGSGTVLIEAEKAGVQSIGIEAHPFLARVARAKLLWREDPSQFHEYAIDLLRDAKSRRRPHEETNALLLKCYTAPALHDLTALRAAWEEGADGSPNSELAWLALAASLRLTSPVGTAQCQYVLPKKRKARTVAPFEAYRARVRDMVEDMYAGQRRGAGSAASVHREDARECASVPDEWANLVVTSPPYANNYDYADATRLEMTFFGQVERWGDLQAAVRHYLIRSCTQHVSADVSRTFEIVKHPSLARIAGELEPVCSALAEERKHHGGKKNYHTMIALYFLDLAAVWRALRRVTAPRADICFVIGDSAPYGVYVPVDKWLGELAIANGFQDWRFEKLRDRNVKWRNRKHRVPLKEGRLWIRG